ncbi:hypothetical protein AB1286_04495 [Trinickia sp. NRRL B-1857]|uniref:hypothetical protein n=1 Tax=Trinickia sp. NRRL B-1857 TaxID=3162879 RepID=UPI003D2B7076
MIRRWMIAVWMLFAVGMVQSALAQAQQGASSQTRARAPAEHVTAQMTAQERAAFEQLRKKAGPSGRAPIDLTDSEQRLAYFALLRMHGITRSSRPALFAQFDRAIETQRGESKSGSPVRVSDCQLPTQGANVPAAQVGDFRDILDIDATPDFKTVSARALDTVVDPATYVLDMIDVYDAKWERVLSSGTDEGFTKATGGCTVGQCLDPHLQIFQTEKKPGNNPSGGPINVFGTFSYRSAAHTYSPCLVMLSGPVHGMPKSMDLKDPSVQYGNDVNRPIIICINRANKTAEYPNACDYGPMMPGVHNNDAHVQVYVVGNVVYNDPLALFDASDAAQPNIYGELTVIPPATGGACPVIPIEGKTLLSHFSVSGDRKTLSFNWPPPSKSANGRGDPADLGNICWQQVANNSLWDFLLKIHVKTLDRAGAPAYEVYAAFLSRLPASTLNELKVPQLVFQLGCLKGGTQVTMADGTRKAIEQVRIGDLVASPHGPEKVRGVTTGTDTRFVKIATAQPGEEPLYVTETHPIALDGGRSMAGSRPRLVEAEDLLRTRAADPAEALHVLWTPGASAPRPQPFAVEHVTGTAYPVYNLTLERPDGEAIAREEALFYANGIVVGDNREQGALEQTKREAATRLPEYRLGGLERVDFDNWRAAALRPSATPGTGKVTQ